MDWKKSSYSGSSGANCVETASDKAGVHVRDSQAPENGSIAFSPETWNAFTASIK